MRTTKKTKAAGSRRERQVQEALEADGWKTRRPRVSLGPADIVASKPNTKLLIQVKANKGSPWMNFRKNERAELLEEAKMAGGFAVLIHWPPYGECKWYYSESWPNGKE